MRPLRGRRTVGPVNRRPPDDDPVHQITSATSSRSADLDRRINRYLISMAIRTACVILVFVVTGPLRWVFVVGAVFLPYVAVLLANTGVSRRGRGPRPVDRRGLTAAPHEPPVGPTAEPAPYVVVGDRFPPSAPPTSRVTDRAGPGPAGTADAPTDHSGDADDGDDGDDDVGDGAGDGRDADGASSGPPRVLLGEVVRPSPGGSRAEP
jgi:hypothetical protein